MAAGRGKDSAIAKISIEADDIEFGRVLSGDFELERIIPMGTGGKIPLIWLNEGDPEAFETKVSECEGTEEIRQLVPVSLPGGVDPRHERLPHHAHGLQRLRS